MSIYFITYRKEKSSGKSSKEIQDQENIGVVHPGDNRLSTNQEQSEISRAAAALVQSFDLSQSQEKNSEKPASLKPKETSDDEGVVLPHWQQKQQEVLQQANATEEKKSSSNTSSSQASPSDDQLKGESPPPQVQQWQSVVSAVGSSSSGSQGTKVDCTTHESNANKEKPVQVVDVSFLEETVAAPLTSKAECHKTKEASQGLQLSLSPSSLVIDPFKPDEGKNSEESTVLIPGPTQPDMSEDMFRPVVTQESREQQTISGC